MFMYTSKTDQALKWGYVLLFIFMYVARKQDLKLQDLQSSRENVTTLHAPKFRKPHTVCPEMFRTTDEKYE
jgi:hypothetical protein